MTVPMRQRILSDLVPIRQLRIAALIAIAPLGLVALASLTCPVAEWQGSPLGSAWHALIVVAFCGFLLAYALLWPLSLRACPACGERLFRGRPRFGARQFNPFLRQCLSCGLHLDGSNVDDVRSRLSGMRAP
jgi:hypothetical protein